jgi:hypothetical protein
MMAGTACSGRAAGRGITRGEGYLSPLSGAASGVGEEVTISFKGAREDKSAESLPRSITSPREVTQKLREAVALGAKDRAVGLVEQLEKRWLRTNKEELQWSRDRGSMAMLEAFAEALNGANDVRCRAIGLVSGLVARF